ncbi:MAG TPA: histidine phosphatase family protein [Polyangiaceae bacterium]|nr:histidine phosphatase family protein [Polyangiaceae bacterium]
MSTLLLLRHGQAHAFDADSDRLTERGVHQAQVLGEALANAGVVPDEVVTGSLVRQRRTAEGVRAAYEARGLPFPELRQDPSWNEYDAGGILGSLLPALAARDAPFAGLVTEFQGAAARADRNRHFQRMFEVLMAEWARGNVTSEGVESFASFHARVRGALRGIVTRRGAGTVLAFTSGGPIGVSVQDVLDAPPETALRVNFRVKNASVTELVFSEGRVSLDRFNGVEHLPPELRTFR